MQKRLSKIIVLTILAVLCAVGFLTVSLLSNKNADAETVVKETTYTFTDDFDSGEKRLSEMNIYKYDHVVAPYSSASTNGLMPTGTWSDPTDYGTGYIIYKISPSANKALTSATITFNTWFGYGGGIADYYNYNDIQIFVSDNEETFGNYVFSLAKATAGGNFTITRDDTEAEVYGFNNYSTNITVTGDISSYLYPETDNYVKILLKHMSVEEIRDAYIAKDPVAYPNGHPSQSADNINMAMGWCGTHMHNLTMTYKEAKPTKLTTISHDLTANDGKGASSLGFYEYDHVYKISNGHVFGLIPSTNWTNANTCSNLGDGYFTYKLTPSQNYNFDSVDIDTNIQFNHKQLGQTINENRTNFLIKVSPDNATWTTVFNMYRASEYSDFTVVKIDTGETFTGGLAGGDQWAHTFYYNIKGDISKYIVADTDNYVRFEMVQMDYAEHNAYTLATWGKTVGAQYGTSVADDEAQMVQLGRVNVSCTAVTINTYEVKSNVSSGSAFYDYNTYTAGSTEWTQDAFSYSGLQIVGPVGGSFVDDETGAYYESYALTSMPKSEGYVIYKYQAPEGYAFGTGDITMKARLFDYNMQGAGEKVDFYYSYDNEVYNLLYTCPITNNHKSSYTKFNFNEFVFGESVVYIKLVIGNSSNYPEWTCVGNLAIDLTYQSSQITVDFGNGYTEKYTVVKGEKFNPEVITAMPEGFVREGTELYTDSACIELFDANGAISSDITLYVKGVWDKHDISYVLNGGTNSDQNPDYYVSAVGATLYIPTYSGYVFAGWYTESTFENYIDNIPVGRTGDITLYAKWELDVEIDLVYNIVYNLDGGENNENNPATYRTIDGATLYAPTKDGYDFSYWTDQNGAIIESISVGRIGDIILTANWGHNSGNPSIPGNPSLPGSDVIASASLTIGYDLTLNYYVSLKTTYSVVFMRFTMNDVIVDVEGYEDGGYIRFDFVNIAPQCMGDNVKAELCVDGEVVATKDDYSILIYCNNILANNPSEELATLVADLLEYGASAQLYKGYKTDALVNEGITGKSEFTEVSSNDKNRVVVAESEGFDITSMGVYFYYSNNVYIKFNAGENFKVTIDDVDYTDEVIESGDGYIVYSDSISALNFDKVFTFNLYDGDTLVQTATYSVKSFVNSYQNGNDTVATLAKALYNYGLSANAYIESKEN